MDLHSDFTQRVLIHAGQESWRPSPMAGVDRRMLDRIGDEVARATTIVRYAPGSKFSAHTHTGGEEFIVLDGIFQDEHGDYPAGTYVRNPPTSSHTPGAAAGCVIFVKLWQFDMDDRTQLRIDMDAALTSEIDGVSCAILHKDAREVVRYQSMKPDSTTQLDNTGGSEILVLDGSLSESGDHLPKGGWLRLPVGAPTTITAGSDGAKIWFKTGHLPFATAPKV